MVRLHENFEWDQDKADKNLQKHKIAFEDAAAILGDPKGDLLQLEVEDGRHNYGETRMITPTSDPEDRTKFYAIVWTPRVKDGRRITRIISAHPASRKERLIYEQSQNTDK